MIVKYGGKLGLSDDSHGKHAVGLNYDRLADYLVTSGITEIYHLGREEAGVGKLRPVLVEGDWRGDPFWN
jgi:histidinol-phosphatase (PHP family)